MSLARDGLEVEGLDGELGRSESGEDVGVLNISKRLGLRVHLGLLGRVNLAQSGLVFDGRLGHGREVANVVANHFWSTALEEVQAGPLKIHQYRLEY